MTIICCTEKRVNTECEKVIFLYLKKHLEKPMDYRFTTLFPLNEIQGHHEKHK